MLLSTITNNLQGADALKKEIISLCLEKGTQAWLIHLAPQTRNLPRLSL